MLVGRDNGWNQSMPGRSTHLDSGMHTIPQPPPPKRTEEDGVLVLQVHVEELTRHVRVPKHALQRRGALLHLLGLMEVVSFVCGGTTDR